MNTSSQPEQQTLTEYVHTFSNTQFATVPPQLEHIIIAHTTASQRTRQQHSVERGKWGDARQIPRTR